MQKIISTSRAEAANPRQEGAKMHNVFEVFKDGKRFLLFSNEDYFICEVWVRNHGFCTNALQRGISKLVIE